MKNPDNPTNASPKHTGHFDSPRTINRWPSPESGLEEKLLRSEQTESPYIKSLPPQLQSLSSLGDIFTPKHQTSSTLKHPSGFLSTNTHLFRADSLEILETDLHQHEAHKSISLNSPLSHSKKSSKGSEPGLYLSDNFSFSPSPLPPKPALTPAPAPPPPPPKSLYKNYLIGIVLTVIICISIFMVFTSQYWKD